MNQIDSCEFFQSDLSEEDNDRQCLISGFAIGSMNEDGNTDMNKDALDNLQYGEGDSFLMEPRSQPFDSQEPNSQNSPRYNVHQGFTVVDFNSTNKRFEQDDQFGYSDDNNVSCIHLGSDGFVPDYSVNNEIPSSPCNSVPKDGGTDSANSIYSEGHEKLVAKNNNGRQKAQHWTQKEKDLLEEGVKLYGTTNWKKVALYVGSRNVSQCVNKYKNQRSEGWKKWNKDATKVLKELINQGLSFQETLERMTDYTYNQINQHYKKFTMNDDPWEDWELELLIELKKEGKLNDTEIGKKLNNRHRDSVRSKWNEIKKKLNLFD